MGAGAGATAAWLQLAPMVLIGAACTAMCMLQAAQAQEQQLPCCFQDHLRLQLRSARQTECTVPADGMQKHFQTAAATLRLSSAFLIFTSWQHALCRRQGRMISRTSCRGRPLQAAAQTLLRTCRQMARSLSAAWPRTGLTAWQVSGGRACVAQLAWINCTTRVQSFSSGSNRLPDT